MRTSLWRDSLHLVSFTGINSVIFLFILILFCLVLNVSALICTVLG